jgi:subtilisin family serine protease
MKRDQIEELFYGKPEQQRRFTQDFPILPDVWIEYGKAPDKRVEVLLTPHNESDAPSMARALRARLDLDRKAADKRRGVKKPKGPDTDRPRVLFNESVVLASLSFRELLRDALPLTNWWQRVVAPIGSAWTPENIRTVAATLGKPNRGRDRTPAAGDRKLLQKLIRVVGSIELERQQRPVAQDLTAPALTADEIDAFASVYEHLLPVPSDTAGVVWSISLNRRASTSVWRSRLTVKADAAARLFAATTTGIRWAVLDTGIDATHKAFRRRNAKNEIVKADRSNKDDGLASRVVRTYDFLRIKNLLDPDPEANTPVTGTPITGIARGTLQQLREELRGSLLRGRSIDWDLLEPLLRVPHTRKDYQPPRFDSHGTHVAGILAANWQEAPNETPLTEPLLGVCPELELYDLRVLPDDPNDTADEFTIIAALQFIRHMNAHKDLMVVHGVNLSLSVPHDVANYACGRTPVCEECERVAASGVVVVTAAGNRGFNKLQDADGGAIGDYRYISITDPGNADGVITVGSTHRTMPHNYGVSYFSSRGPTGDGRTKPDLIAPGERIDSCSLNGYYETMDGTSMAAPHVSGAAALLIGRHRELIGQPGRVKQILCNTATDLGREPRFQGHGMVDVLRAIQSV